MLTRSAKLPPHSAILFAILMVDAEGVPYVEDGALTDLRRVANAPIFGVRSTQLGRGIVGGPLLSMEDLSRNTTRVAVRLLDSAPGGPISTPTQKLAAPTFDWRELRRWGIDEARLQPGSTISFREPTAWERYKRPIVVVGAVAGIQAVLVVGLVVNLTRQRRAQRSLRASEARFRQLSDTAPVMLWTASPDGQCTHVNRARLEFTGRPLESELGNGWSDVVHADDIPRSMEAYTRAFERREPFRTKYRLRRHDGEYRWILDTAVPRVFADGTFAGYVGSGIDVTDLELAKSSLSNLSRRLLHEQEQERALVARALADDLCQQLTVLMLRLHEFSQAPPAADEGQMRMGVEEVKRQLAILSGRIFAMSDQLRSSKLEILGLTAATRLRCRELSAAAGVTIDVHDEGVPPEVPDDVSLVLFRVIDEALNNALTHAEAGRVTVSLRGGSGEIQLEVADDGVGFDPRTVTMDRSLGFAEMRERLHLVDGECAIESRPGAGTRVRVRVPMRADVYSAAE
jgi:PAS domain S-box-containing protein